MIALLCLFVAAQATTVQDAKNRPVTKVINLLKDMQSQLAKEQVEDEEVYEKVACWCTTNDKQKTAAISDAEARITDLTSTIEEFTATSSRLNTEIKNLNAEIAKNEAALDKATSIRQRELAEFNGEEKDMLQSIGALKSATTVLGKHNSFAQVSSEALIDLAATIQDQFRKHKDILNEIVTPSQRKTIAAFVQSPSDYFDADPTFKQSYAPQSGAIFGILKQMKETFETNLGQSQKDEMIGQQAYSDLKAAKEAEISAGEDQRDTKVQELADTDEKLANSKTDLEDTRNMLSADQTFLMNLKETCQMTDQEWEERQKTRAEEIQACSEALAVLSSDDAHDTFTKTFNFLQITNDSTRAQAEKVLLQAAKQFGNPKLSALANRVRLDAFGKIIEDIKGMITALQKEKADDIKHKDFCVEEQNQNERAQELKARDINELDAKIADLTSTISQLEQNIADLNSQVAEMQTQLKRAGEDREAENSDFQTTVSDQRATQKLLASALNVLKGFYDKKSLLQKSKQEPAGPPPPSGFKTYEKQGGAGGVLGMLEQIISEAKQLEGDAIKAEADSQKAYESFVKDSNKSLGEKNRDLINKSSDKAQNEADKTASEEAKDAASAEQQQNMNENADLHKSCDFTLQNFDVRQASLEQESEALRQAIAVLSGSSVKVEFLQKRK